MRNTFIKITLFLSIVTLIILCISSFYGPYTGKFYFLKASSYIIPILTIVHFIFLYVLWFKIKEDELTDLPMRNLEYGLYAIFFFYIYKFYQSITVLNSYKDFENHLLPEKFMTIQTTITVLYLVLLVLTLLTFLFRKRHVGNYNFEDANKIDSWD